MSRINCPRVLKQEHGISPLMPFGLLISSRKKAKISDFSPAFLERILRQEKLIVLRGFEAIQSEKLVGFCKRFSGEGLLQWDFGPVMEMRRDPKTQNYLFSSESVPFHWDGAFHREPHFLVFNCLQAPPSNAGGETLFTNTEFILRDATEATIERWSKISLHFQTEKLVHYGGKIRIPLVQKHPIIGSRVLRYAEKVETNLNPVSLEVEGLDPRSVPRFLKEMTKKIYDPHYCYPHQWVKGDLLIADNYSLIHGRRAFNQTAPRHLRRIQIL